MLIGQYSGVIGAKRRVAIPKRFVQELGSEPIVAKWYEKCLVLVSKEKWSELLNKVKGNNLLVTEPIRDIDRFILGSAFELEADIQGRVVIPEMLCQFAGIASEVIFLGLGDRVEIWDKDVWREKQENILDQAHKALEEIAKNE